MQDPAHPTYDHDHCQLCRFVGTSEPEPGEPRANVVDIWICRDTRGRAVLIRRYSSVPSDYACAVDDDGRALRPRYHTSVRLAHHVGLLEKDEAAAMLGDITHRKDPT